MPGRTYNAGNYAYGLMGKEKSNEIYGEGNAYDFGDRIQDPRIVRWFSTDPLQMKYPGTSPYVFCGNNPIFYVDPDGRVLQFYGDAKEFRKTEALINNKFAGSNVKVVIGANGIMTITGDTKKLSSQQLALYNSLNTVITSKGTTNMYALKSSERQYGLGGSFSGNKDASGNDQSITVGGVKKNAQFYDVYDMEALDKNKADGISGVSDLAHEIYEAYMYQDQKVTDFTKAHNAALKVQGDVDGYTNVQNTTVQGSGIMNVTYTTSDGKQMRSDLPYSNNDFNGASTTTDITPPPVPTQTKPQITPPLKNNIQELHKHNDRLINRTGL